YSSRSARRSLVSGRSSFSEPPPKNRKHGRGAQCGPGPGREVLPAWWDVIFIAPFVREGDQAGSLIGECTKTASPQTGPDLARMQVNERQTLLLWKVSL